MKRRSDTRIQDEAGGALLAALGTILILSLVGAGVLMNATTRYNATATQVKGWKEALLAAEAGGDIAFSILRKDVVNPREAFSKVGGWNSPAPAPISNPESWSIGFDNLGFHNASPISFGDDARFSTRVTVDRFHTLPGNDSDGYYRIRSTGTAQITGLKRVGMDNRTNEVSKGDNLLRKIDFNFQHFKAAYGFGDALPAAGQNATNGKEMAAVTSPTKPEVSRRVEIVAVPVMAIEGSVKTQERLRASGATFDSYNSAYGPHPGTPNPAPPRDVDAHDADMVCGSSDFDATYIYGDITTNGGAAKTSQASGVVDNNVPVVLAPAVPGVAPLPSVEYFPPTTSSPLYVAGSPSTISPDPTPYPTKLPDGVTPHPKHGQYPTEFWYHYSGVNDLTINPVRRTVNGVANQPVDTTVNIYVSGDVRGLTVARGVTAKIYFRGNMDGKANDYQNLNADGPGGNGVYVPNFVDRGIDPVTGVAYSPRFTIGRVLPGITRTNGSKNITSTAAAFSADDIGKSIEGAGIPNNATIAAVTNATSAVMSLNATATSSAGDVTVAAYLPSPLVSRAGHMWFYGISPPAGTSRTIDIAPPGDGNSFYAGVYAPGHDFTTRGNPDFYGCFVVKSFYTNGNNQFHFDKQLANTTDPVDYRVASYIEDIR